MNGILQFVPPLMLISVWVLILVQCVRIAKKKNYSPIGSFILGFIFGILWLAILLMLPDKNAKELNTQMQK